MGIVENETAYYYVTNLQGDVVGIVRHTGQRVVTYTYDAWGNVLSITGSKADTLGKINPIRYRGYVYDQETGLYYLQSRYYNPETGRFINADGFTSTGQGILGNNMFTYCGNNSVIRYDSNGAMHVYNKFCGGGKKPTPQTLIQDQTADGIGNLKYGMTTIGNAGCGPIAVYNALLLLGEKEVSLNDIIAYFEQNDGLYLGGLLGSRLETCIQFFNEKGYATVCTDSYTNDIELERAADANIVWYFYNIPQKKLGIRAHFMAFKQYGEIGAYNNYGGNSAKSYPYFGSFGQFMKEDADSEVYFTIHIFK